MKNLQTSDKKIRVNFFQRKPRKGVNFSLEYIFDDIRNRLKLKIESKIFISKFYNDGYFSKIINVVEASLRQKKDVNHIAGEMHFLNLLMKKNRVVLTVLDCAMMRMKTGIAQTFLKWLYLTLPVKKAKIVTAISEVTKNEILGYVKCNPEKIRVIPVAVDPLFQPVPKLFNKEKPVILQIGTGFHKNLVRLIEAINGINCHLCIVGKLSTEHLEALRNYNIEYSNEYNISNERMLNKYIDCDIVAFASIFEGFGMPIVEANAVERVVVTSNITAMPEVAGNAACLVDPYDVDSIRNGILNVINRETYRNQLIENGRQNKMRFDADIIANSYYKLYEEIYFHAK